MPKTNHERDFVDERDYRSDGRDNTRGKHGQARKKAGAKKFRRSRQRFNQNNELVKAILDPDDFTLTPTKFDFDWGERSKLRATSNPGEVPRPYGLEWKRAIGRSGWRDRLEESLQK